MQACSVIGISGKRTSQFGESLFSSSFGFLLFLSPRFLFDLTLELFSLLSIPQSALISEPTSSLVSPSLLSPHLFSTRPLFLPFADSPPFVRFPFFSGGGCMVPFGSQPTGQDCTLIPNVEGVDCVKGRCVVSECARGLVVDATKSSCVSYVGVESK